MKRRALLIAAVVGLLLAADAPNKDDKPVPPNGDGAYAKVELKGRSAEAQLPERVVLLVGNDEYELDFSQLKEPHGEALRKLMGETALVTGRLRLPSNKTERVRVLVSAFRVVKR